MEINLYNSLTKKIEKFKPITDNVLNIYVCGPTVYNHMHIGNARPVVFFDTLCRFFKYLGYEVNYVTNFTDIDDKIIKAAHEAGVSEKEISEHYISEYQKVVSRLNCLNAKYNPKVTETMQEITDFIEELVDKGYAYTCGTDTYFRTTKVPTYGMLSNQKIEDLNYGSRIDVANEKENPCDFTLWKKTSDEGIKWPSKLGDGRPGWHTECVVMIDKIFGGKIDIHGGGNDLKFPHHENEIAQSMAMHNHPIANFWIHNARVDLNGEKMSKSLGNVIWIKDLITEYSANAYRLMILSSQYRQNINYSSELMASYQKEIEKIERTYLSLYRNVELSDELEQGKVIDEFINRFIKEMANDLNTANAITILYELIKQINKDLRSKEKLYPLKDLLKTVDTMFTILGFKMDVTPLNDSDIEIVKKWQIARENKDFITADVLKEQINSRGIKL